MVDSIKITALQDIGANIAYTTLVPVVNMAGTPTTQKSNLQNLGNLILNGAGGSYFAPAARAISSQSVTNAAQPNITSVGTLNINTLHISGGINGYVLKTDGTGNLAWIPSSTGVSGSNTQVQFNNAGSFGSSANFTYDNSNNILNVIGANASYLTVTNTANLGAVGNITITGGSNGQVLTTNGNGVLSWSTATSSYSNTNVANYLPTFTGTVGANRISSNALSGSNIEINANGAVFAFGQGGALYWPAPSGNQWVIEPNIDNEFEIKSTSNVVISTDTSNANSHFTFDSDGIFTAPSNVNLLGSRLNVGPEAANIANLASPTLIIANSAAEFIQAAIININSDGSADWIAQGADSDDAQGYSDLGFAGHSFNDPNFTITAPGDGYVFSQGYANGIGGSLVIATGENGNVTDIVFATGGFLANNEFARIDHANDVFHLTRANSGIQFSDGSIQTTAGGGGSTGNVTFDDVTVQGVNQLNLSAGADFTANLAYLQVRSGDVASHIHFDTGNNEAYDLIVGNDNKFVQVSSTGNIIMSSYDGNVSYAMTLDTTGNLTIPNDIISNSTIEIDNRASGNTADIIIYSADDITLQARDRPIGATAEGGDINIFAGDSAEDSDTSAGDIIIEAGRGGASNIDFGGSGGFVRIEAGQGGAASTDANGFSALSGGALTLRAGSAGTNNGNIDRGDTGGDVTIEAGDSTGNGDPGGSIILRSGDAGANALAGQIQLIISGGDVGPGGTWTFDGNGIIQLPNSGTIGNDGNNIDIGSTSAISLEASTVVNIYTDTGTAAYQWQFNDNGQLRLPTIELDVGNTINEQTVIQSQRKIIPGLRYSVAIDGSTPTTVYTATSVDTTSMKVAMQIQHSGLGFEFFDVSATSSGSDTYYTVSNRLHPPGITDSTVVVDLNGSNFMDITVTINSGAANSWVTYDAVEFGIPQD
jgi:hypothetical protein